MFSKAKRFDYYPKPEEPSPNCHRCSHKHVSFSKRDTISKKSSTILKKDSEKSQNFDYKKSVSDDLDYDNSSPGSSLNSSIFSLFEEIPLSQETVVDIHHNETIYDSVLEVATPVEAKKKDLHEYLDNIEKKIDEQRQKISNLRHQLITPSSGDEGIHSSRCSSPSDIQERIKHVEDLSRFCVKETLDFITLYNKFQEAKCTSRPQDYRDLVEFCSELILELSGKLSTDKKSRKRWKKMKSFFRGFAGPFRKISRIFSGHKVSSL